MRVLLAEDELQLSRVISAAISREGYNLDVVHDGQGAVEFAANNAYDVMVMDIMMSKKTGIEALREIRSSGNDCHVIMLTAMAEVDDRVTGLDAGADDYLTKPFSLKELLARLRSIERRLETLSPNIIEIGSVKLNVGEQELSSSNSIRLAGKEAKMMAYFMRNLNKSLSSDMLLTHVWPKDEAEGLDHSYVFVYVSYLRQKLQAINADLSIKDVQEGHFKLVSAQGESMFRRLRIRFIVIVSLAISILMAAVLEITTSVRYFQTQREISSVLEVLSDNKGSFPSLDEAQKKLGRPTTQDTLSQYRFLSAQIDNDGNVSHVDTNKISELSQKDVEYYAVSLVRKGKQSGRFKDDNRYYAYQLKKISNRSQQIIILDASWILADYHAILNISIWLGLIGIIFFIMIISALSQKVIDPYIRNYEKQKRFITNAGHELKTPLAIISANNELVELMTGESEWTKSTADQVHRLTELINQMVTLARLEEQEDVVLHDLDFSAITQDAAEDFKGPVIKDGKRFQMTITPNLHVKAEEKSLFELVTILVDDANKYCDPGGQVSVSLRPTGTVAKKARLSISNTYKADKNVDYSRFFERFYREDESHNNDHKAGYGIGLSMAEGIVNLFHGNIFAHYKHDTITFTVIS